MKKKRVRSEITRACLFKHCTVCFVICPCKCHDDERRKIEPQRSGAAHQGELFS